MPAESLHLLIGGEGYFLHLFLLQYKRIKRKRQECQQITFPPSFRKNELFHNFIPLSTLFQHIYAMGQSQSLDIGKLFNFSDELAFFIVDANVAIISRNHKYILNIRRIGGYGLCGLDDDFDGRHIIYDLTIFRFTILERRYWRISLICFAFI